MAETFANFSEEQKKAIIHESGPAMVLAGPGSGKTLVIVNRIRYLIKEKQVPPNKIAVITFTKAAALEMKSRAGQLLLEAADVAFGTFHSIFYQILRNSMEYRNFSIIDSREKNQIIKQILYTKFGQTETVNQYIEVLSEKISYFLNTKRYEDSDFMDEDLFYELFERYRKECIRRKKLDFDLILSECLNYLKKNTAALQKWQNYFSYFLIDEFQDCNEIQYQIVSLLVEKHRNIFVVGDDDQSIYSFRGADPSMMFRFVEDYKDSVRITLSKNYRCCKEILAFADASIRQNQKRFEKELSASKVQKGKVLTYFAESQEDELEWLTEQIKKVLLTGNVSHQIAILMRTESKFSYITARLKKEGIKTALMTKNDKFFEKEQIKDIMAYLKFVFEGRKRRDILRVINKPERYLCESCFDTEVVDFERVHIMYKKSWAVSVGANNKECNESNEVIQNLERLKRDMDFMRDLDAYGCVCYILYAMKYEAYAYAHKTEEEREEISGLLEEIKQLAKTSGDVKSLFHLAESKEDAADVKNGIRMMTYHASKGLEFEHVFLPFVNEFIVPHKKAVLPEAVEEERRMFYVAMTRAKDALYISCVQNGATQPSRFLKEKDEQKSTHLHQKHQLIRQIPKHPDIPRKHL